MKHPLIKLFTLGILVFPIAAQAADQVITYNLQEGDELHLCIHQTADYSFSVNAGGRVNFYPSAIAEDLPALVPDSELGVLPVGGRDGAMIYYNNQDEVRTKDVLFYAILAAPRLQSFFNQDHQDGPPPYVMVKTADYPNPCVAGEEIPGGWIVHPLENITMLHVTQVTEPPQAEVEPAPEVEVAVEPEFAPQDPSPLQANADEMSSGGCSLGANFSGGSSATWLIPITLLLGMLRRKTHPGK